MGDEQDATFEFSESEFLGGEERKRGRLGERYDELIPKKSETTREGDASEDIGLRRRFVSISSGTLENKFTTNAVITCAGDSPSEDSIKPIQDQPNYGKKDLDTISRKIFNPEKHLKIQPTKLRKKKLGDKVRRSTTKSSNPVDTFVQGEKKIEQAFEKLWQTGDEFKLPAEDIYPIFVLRDFIVYLIFLVVVMVITFGPRGPADNYYSEVVRRLVTNSSYNSSLGSILSFGDTQSARDMWTYIVDVLFLVLYDHTLVDNNIYFGAPRLRQLRVRGKTCSSAPMFQSLYVDCADYFSENIEDKEEFGLKTSAWRYLPSLEEQSYYTGMVSTYPGGGFVLNFTTDENFTKNSIAELRDENWIGFGTRVMFIEFALFNQVTQLFCVCKVVFEFPPFGGIIPSFTSSTLKLLRYVKPWDYFILSCELILGIFTLYYTVEESLQMYRQGRLYLSNKWNVLDVFIIISCYITITFGVLLTIKANSFIRQNIGSFHTSIHVPFDEMTNIQTEFDVARAVLIFVVWLKIFKFSTLNRSVALIMSAYTRVGTLIITVTIMMMTIIMGFAVVSYILLAPLFHGYETFGRSIQALMCTLAGGVHYWKYDGQHVRANFGTLFGFMGVGMFFFLTIRVVIVNLYVAILANSLEEGEMQFNQISNSATISDYFREVYCKCLRHFGKYATAREHDQREVQKQNIRIYDTLVKILRRHGYEDIEIDLLLEQYDIIYGDDVGKESMINLYNNIYLRNQLSLEVEAHSIIQDQIGDIDKHILLMNDTLIDIMSKLDILTDRYLAKKSLTPLKPSSWRK